MNLDKKNIALIKKDRTAQKQFYDFIYANLFHIPNRYKKTQRLAEEIFNDAMLKIFDSIYKVDNIDNVLAWSSKIIFNTTIDSLRREIKLNDRFSYPDELPVMETSMNTALDHLAVEELFECIQTLDQNQLAVFSLFEIDGYSHKEISELINITVSNSKYLLHMAKKELRVKVETFQN